MIAYSPDAEPARAYLLRAYNDIDIFVEDCACQNMYVRLINRMLEPMGKRINNVFPLQSRKNVIEQCRADQARGQRPKLYIIDADQDLLLGEPKPRLKHLYRLSVYCAENLLLSEHAIVTIATESASSTSWADMAIALSIRSLLQGSVEILMILFVAYAVVRKCNLTIETVKFPVQRLLVQQHDAQSLSRSLILGRVRSILRTARAQVSRSRYRKLRRPIVSRLIAKPRDRSDYISGKTYLLPLVQLQLRRVAGLQGTSDSLKVRLAKHCELTIDPGLQRAVLRALKGR